MLEPEIQQQLDSLRELLARVMGRFAAASVIDRAGFESLRATLPSFVDSCRTIWLLPKDFLGALRSAQWQLTDGAKHSDDPQFVREQASIFERAFDSLLAGEGMNDRSPGVPRII